MNGNGQAGTPAPTKSGIRPLFVWGGFVLAAILFTLNFGYHVANFWVLMTLATALLGTIALIGNRELLKPPPSWGRAIIYGVGSAALLYLIFFVGSRITAGSWFHQRVASVYDTKSQAQAWLIALLLIFPIGPGEELFWRGLVQQHLTNKYGFWGAWYIAASYYSLIHLGSANAMLMLAAMICGLFWGALYQFTKSIWPGIISHILWDVTVFIVLPFN